MVLIVKNVERGFGAIEVDWSDGSRMEEYGEKHSDQGARRTAHGARRTVNGIGYIV